MSAVLEARTHDALGATAALVDAFLTTTLADDWRKRAVYVSGFCAVRSTAGTDGVFVFVETCALVWRRDVAL